MEIKEGKHKGKFLLFRRPTDMEMVKLRSAEAGQFDMLKGYVYGWEGFTELDLVSGGTGEVVTFHSELWNEWVEDHPELWKQLTDAIMEAYRKHEESLVKAEKK